MGCRSAHTAAPSSEQSSSRWEIITRGNCAAGRPRTERCSGMITAVGTPAAAWHRARPATASASPPVCAYGAYSATTCTTLPGGSAGSKLPQTPRLSATS